MDSALKDRFFRVLAEWEADHCTKKEKVTLETSIYREDVDHLDRAFLLSDFEIEFDITFGDVTQFQTVNDIFQAVAKMMSFTPLRQHQIKVLMAMR